MEKDTAYFVLWKRVLKLGDDIRRERRKEGGGKEGWSQGTNVDVDLDETPDGRNTRDGKYTRETDNRHDHTFSPAGHVFCEPTLASSRRSTLRTAGRARSATW